MRGPNPLQVSLAEAKVFRTGNADLVHDIQRGRERSSTERLRPSMFMAGRLARATLRRRQP